MLNRIAYLHTLVLHKRQKGLTVVEYAIAGGVIVAGLVAVFVLIGSGASAKLETLNSNLG